mmetsp:Transcript_27694/g.70558  ORF Transcript_27694/g.70558 Transcript_27694/m.70558 type:complete len:292 (+) Transcript_27694:319-1194(+)
MSALRLWCSVSGLQEMYTMLSNSDTSCTVPSSSPERGGSTNTVRMSSVDQSPSPSSRRFLALVRHASLNSSEAMRAMKMLSALLAAMLYLAASTPDLATSVATTRLKFCASGMVKLPLPQYSSSRSVVGVTPAGGVVTCCAHDSMCWHTPALGWLNDPSICWYTYSLPLTDSRSSTHARSSSTFCLRLRPSTCGVCPLAAGTLASFACSARAASFHTSSSCLWYRRVTTESPLRVVWKLAWKSLSLSAGCLFTSSRTTAMSSLTSTDPTGNWSTRIRGGGFTPLAVSYMMK